MDLKEWDARKVAVGYLVGSCVGAYSLYIASMEMNRLGVMLWFLGGILGWILGMIYTPSVRAEKEAFAKIFPHVATLIGGFSLAKFDGLYQYAIPTSRQDAGSYLMAWLIFLVPLFLGILFTFVGRTSFAIEDRKSARHSSPPPPSS